jgi:hypothetical protein
LTSLLLLIAAPTFAFAPAHVVHEMVGQMLPNAYDDGIVTMRVDCVFYEEGPTCTGRWRCKRAPGAGREPSPSCRHGQARVVLDMDALVRDDHLSHDATLSLSFSDGASCSFVGTVPFSFGQVPAVSGQYERRDAGGGAIEQGLFGFRARSIGQPFHRFD